MDQTLALVLIIVAIVVVAIVVWLFVARASLRKRNGRVDEAWAQVHALLEKRGALLPQLISTVQGVSDHEQQVFDELTRARDESVSAQTPADASVAENHVQGALRSLFGVAEGYPQLQANTKFLTLQRELAGGEDQLQAARRGYNGSVRELNAKVHVFPSSLAAKTFGVPEREFYEVADRAAISEPPRVQF